MKYWNNKYERNLTNFMNRSTNFLKLLGSQDLLIKPYDEKIVMYGYERGALKAQRKPRFRPSC
jgi:hypothetical protein